MISVTNAPKLSPSSHLIQTWTSVTRIQRPVSAPALTRFPARTSRVASSAHASKAGVELLALKTWTIVSASARMAPPASTWLMTTTVLAPKALPVSSSSTAFIAPPFIQWLPQCLLGMHSNLNARFALQEKNARPISTSAPRTRVAMRASASIRWTTSIAFAPSAIRASCARWVLYFLWFVNGNIWISERVLISAVNIFIREVLPSRATQQSRWGP